MCKLSRKLRQPKTSFRSEGIRSDTSVRWAVRVQAARSRVQLRVTCLTVLLVAAGAVAASASEKQQGRTRSPHGSLAIACENCHTATSWKPIRPSPDFNHNETRYPLRGMHVGVNCRQCHIKLVFSDVGTQCTDCHADIHRRQMGSNCEQCHSVRGWRVSMKSVQGHENRFPLLGAHAAVDCETCHKSAAVGVFVGLSTDCVSCHLNDYQTARPLDHQAAKLPTTCELCHTSMDSWLGAKFDHARFTGFTLSGAHALLDCTVCHVGGKFAGTPTDCYSCHAKDYAATNNPSHVSLGFAKECSVCHTTVSWAGAKFDHNTLTKFPLTGAHASVACDACHINGKFAGTPTDCYSCHVMDFNATKNPNHIMGKFPTDCSQCHTTSGWNGAKFDHSTTAFPLTGAHASVPCTSCHVNNNFNLTQTSCVSCHLADFNKTTNPNHVAAGLPQDCTLCHTTATWLNATFDHSKTKFPLTGAHVSLQCSACHSNGQFATLSTACVSCHLADFNKTTNPNHAAAGLPQDCTLCHTTATWLNATFDHSKTKFPLTGAHVNLQCSACHANGQFAALSTACVSCHLADFNKTTNPNHAAAGFPQDCTLCHTTATWLNATFDHSKTRFPLTGAHVSLQCSACHSNGQYATLPTACVSCHLADFNKTSNPNHTAAGFPQDCTLCHTTATWLNATFDHSKTRFPLTGAHASLQCSACHSSGQFATLSTACASCHMADFNKTTNPNHVSAGFPQDCSLCHTTASWAGATFNHSNTPFPLTGAHVNVACATCHKNNVFSGLSTACVSCHLADFNGTNNPNHASAGFPQDCSLCHSTTSWAGATFNHNNTPFPLTGAHVNVACATCHKNNVFSGLSTACVSCHLADFNGTNNPNHASAGFPQDCSVCHTTTSWAGATFNHNNTPFPLTGAHVNVACTSCHINNVFAGTPTDCYSCHSAEYNGTTNPNHKSAGFPTTCQTCHTTTAWTGATFNHTWFPTNHGNAQGVCSTCHTNPSDYSVFTCTNCHAQAQTDARHSGIRGYVYNSVNCYQCHQRGGGG